MIYAYCLLLFNQFFPGFGRWTQKSLASFIEDTIFPFPFCQKVGERNTVNLTKRSWRRRVDVNMAFYVTLLITLTSLQVYYNRVTVSIQFDIQCSVIKKSFQLSLCEYYLSRNVMTPTFKFSVTFH